MPSAKRKKETAQKEKPAEKTVETAKNTEMKESFVYIGRKPVMNYVVACLTYFSSGSKKLTVKARGRAIPRAVDTVEVLRRSFAKDLQLESITVCTEEVPREQGRKSNVSSVEIALTKP
jgi:DNA-binding protein